MTSCFHRTFVVFAFVLGWTTGHCAAAQELLDRAHAHNDYEHERPLLDALERGFRSIEADVHLVDGELLVAHDLRDVSPSRTLRSLYLDPLRARLGDAQAPYGPERPLVLLIDVKSEPDDTYRVLRATLRDYADILSIFAGGEVVEGPATAVISGNRARDAMLDATIRFSAYDGRADDLTEHADAPSTFIPLVSVPWYLVSDWQGEGRLPATDLEELRRLVDAAHAQDRMLRFWATPDTSSVWDVLLDEGVDFIGTDDLDAFRTYYLGRD